MRLIDLEPQWLYRDDLRVGFIFRCPHCRETWLTCLFVKLSTDAQIDIWPGGEERLDVVPCREDFAWKQQNGLSFNDMTVEPSLDASGSGHWHGRITKGEIVGGKIKG